jgi:hypothetical protein
LPGSGDALAWTIAVIAALIAAAGVLATRAKLAA